MPNATRPRLVQRRWWLYPWPVAKVTQFTRLQSASILQFQPDVWSPNFTFPLNAPWCQGNNQKSQLHPQSRLLPDLSSICRAKNSPTRPGREGITAIKSSYIFHMPKARRTTRIIRETCGPTKTKEAGRFQCCICMDALYLCSSRLKEPKRLTQSFSQTEGSLATST